MDEAKRDLVRDWLTRAAQDLTAARLLAACQPPLLEIALYHCQQAAEKALKGYLAYWNQRSKRHTTSASSWIE